MTTIIPLDTEQTKQASILHAQMIPTGFLSSLGDNVLAKLYSAVAACPQAFGFVAVENDRPIGFVACTEHLGKLYRYAMIHNGLTMIPAMLPKLFSLQRIKRIFETLFYARRTRETNLPDAELLSIAIAPEAQGKGIGKQLVHHAFEECRKRGITQMKVLVAAENIPANTLYQRCGFKLATQIDSHGIPSNVYMVDLNAI